MTPSTERSATHPAGTVTSAESSLAMTSCVTRSSGLALTPEVLSTSTRTVGSSFRTSCCPALSHRAGSLDVTVVPFPSAPFFPVVRPSGALVFGYARALAPWLVVDVSVSAGAALGVVGEALPTAWVGVGSHAGASGQLSLVAALLLWGLWLELHGGISVSNGDAPEAMTTAVGWSGVPALVWLVDLS